MEIGDNTILLKEREIKFFIVEVKYLFIPVLTSGTHCRSSIL